MKNDTQKKFTVTRIAQGFEFGHGAISGNDASPEMLKLLDYVIQHSPALLVPIDTDNNGTIIDDDGCGDGRGVATVFAHNRKFRRSLNRPKVFGGAATMTLACKIGLGEAGNSTFNQLFSSSIDTLISKKMDFGAHTDEHARGDNCGCGAIDRAPEAIMAALKYETPIRDVIAGLGLSLEGLDAVYDNIREYVGTLSAKPEYSGKLVMDQIIKSAKVVKQLTGDHQERRILVNQVQGYTVDQKLLRDVTGDSAQVFAVDFWRLTAIAKGLYGEDAAKQQQALLSELVYTLAIAAVLTKGDLPVDMIESTTA